MVCVQGYRSSSEDYDKLECWQSSPIADRVDAKTLRSTTGRLYRLLGSIDRDTALVNRMSWDELKPAL